MKELEERIVKDGKIIGDNILKVDSFINHQIDTKLAYQIADYFASSFPNVTKILTIEASGIAFAMATAAKYNFCPLVFARKSSSLILDTKHVYNTKIASYTKRITNNVYVDKHYLKPTDHVLIIDDFMADGNAAMGLIELCKKANCIIEGVAVVIEKAFQHGRRRIEKENIKVISAATIEKFENGGVIFK